MTLFLSWVVSSSCLYRIGFRWGWGWFYRMGFRKTGSHEFFLLTSFHLNSCSLFLQGDFSVPDVPKSMAWCENSICVGFKRDYYLIRVKLTILQISSVFIGEDYEVTWRRWLCASEQQIKRQPEGEFLAYQGLCLYVGLFFMLSAFSTNKLSVCVKPDRVNSQFSA